MLKDFGGSIERSGRESVDSPPPAAVARRAGDVDCSVLGQVAEGFGLRPAFSFTWEVRHAVLSGELHSSRALARVGAATAAALALSFVCGGLQAARLAAKPDASIDGLTAKFVDVGGIRTRYYDYGQGEPIVMLHGGSRSGANVFSRNIPGLAKRFRVLAIDRLVRPDDNPKTAADGGNEGQVRFVRAFIETLKLGPSTWSVTRAVAPWRSTSRWNIRNS